jgi:hypothetical protein
MGIYVTLETGRRFPAVGAASCRDKTVAVIITWVNGVSNRLLHRNFTGAESVNFTALIAQKESAFIVNATDDAVMPAPAFQEGDGFAAEEIIAMPEIGERLRVFSLGKRLVSEQHAANECSRESIEIEGLAGDFSQRDGTPGELRGPAAGGTVNI